MYSDCYDFPPQWEDEINDISDDDFDDEIDPNIPLTDGLLQSLLVVWALKNGISHTALRELLIILRLWHDLPKDPRTLLSTPRFKVPTIQMCGGLYIHYGLIKAVIERLQRNPLLKSLLSLQWNTDGKPFKSKLF